MIYYYYYYWVHSLNCKY